MRPLAFQLAGVATMVAALAPVAAEQARAILIRPTANPLTKRVSRRGPVRLEAWKTDGVVLVHTFDRRDRLVEFHEVAEGEDHQGTLDGMSFTVANTYVGFRLRAHSLLLAAERPALTLVEARVADDEPLKIVEWHRLAERWATREDVAKAVEYSRLPNATALATRIRFDGHQRLTLARDGVEVSHFAGVVSLAFRPRREYLFLTTPGPAWSGYRYSVADVTNVANE